MVLLFIRSLARVLFIRPEAAEDKEWILSYYGESLDDEIEDVCLSPSVNCNIDFYALNDCERKLVRVSVDRADQILLESLQCEMPNTPTFTKVFRKRLVESGGEIYYILIACGQFMGVLEVMVFKLDFSRMVWNTVESLMGRVIFLDESAFSCSAMGKGVESDSIYFTIERDIVEWDRMERDKALYSFNVREGQLLVTLPCPNLPEPWRAPMFLMMPWLRSNHGRVQIVLSEENKSPKGSNGNDKKEDTLRETGEAATLTRFSDLPLEILNLIPDCLNLCDCMNFRAACRGCLSVAPQLQGKQSLSRLNSTPKSPLLIFPNNDTSILNFIDPKHHIKLLKTVPESLIGHKPLYSKDGWLLMSDCKDSVSFYNPFTNEVINLPTPPAGYLGTLNSMCFSSLPTSSDCVVAGFKILPPREVLYTIMGGRWWNLIRMGSLLDYIIPVFYNGALYLLGEAGKLFVLFDNTLVNEWHPWREFQVEPNERYNNFHQCYLLDWSGKLVSVFVGQMGSWVDVFMLSNNKRNWERVESLGNYMFCVSRSSCVAVEAVTVDMKNNIFFPRFHGSNILYYSLDTRRFHSDGHDSFRNFYNTKEQLLAGWMNFG